MAVLVVAEHDNDAIRPATANAAAAAAELGDVVVLVAGNHCRGAAEQAAALAPVTRVLEVDNALYAAELAEPLAALIVSLAADYSHVLAPATTFGKNVMPRAAALLDVAQISEITAIEGPDTFIRPHLRRQRHGYRAVP